jgi:hypothetical protein
MSFVLWSAIFDEDTLITAKDECLVEQHVHAVSVRLRLVSEDRDVRHDRRERTRVERKPNELQDTEHLCAECGLHEVPPGALSAAASTGPISST